MVSGPGSILVQELGQQGLRCDEPHSVTFTDREEVFPVTGHEYVDSSFDRGGQDRVVGRVAGDHLDMWRRVWSFRCQLGEKFARRGRPLDGEAKFLSQHSMQFGTYELGEEKVEPPVDRFLEQAARRAVGDQGRDEDVRVAEDAARQPWPPRNSSTSASTSSGPMPRVSASRRP